MMGAKSTQQLLDEVFKHLIFVVYDYILFIYTCFDHNHYNIIKFTSRNYRRLSQACNDPHELPECSILEDELHVARFPENFESRILKFQKNRK
jgi:hypothetical protein